MAVSVYLSNEKGATEVTLDGKATKEVAIVGAAFKGATPVKIVSRTVRNAIPVRVVGTRFIVNGETLP